MKTLLYSFIFVIFSISSSAFSGTNSVCITCPPYKCWFSTKITGTGFYNVKTVKMGTSKSIGVHVNDQITLGAADGSNIGTYTIVNSGASGNYVPLGGSIKLSGTTTSPKGTVTSDWKC